MIVYDLMKQKSGNYRTLISDLTKTSTDVFFTGNLEKLKIISYAQLYLMILFVKVEQKLVNLPFQGGWQDRQWLCPHRHRLHPSLNGSRTKTPWCDTQDDGGRKPSHPVAWGKSFESIYLLLFVFFGFWQNKVSRGLQRDEPGGADCPLGLSEQHVSGTRSRERTRDARASLPRSYFQIFLYFIFHVFLTQTLPLFWKLASGHDVIYVVSFGYSQPV